VMLQVAMIAVGGHGMLPLRCRKRVGDGFLSVEQLSCDLGAGAAREELSGGTNRSRSVKYWRLAAV
jgi:hypothetical protein